MPAGSLLGCGAQLFNAALKFSGFPITGVEFASSALLCGNSSDFIFFYLVFYSGLNFIDLMVRQGNIDNPPKTPLVPGFECSGIVEALGDSVKGFEVILSLFSEQDYIITSSLSMLSLIPSGLPETAAFTTLLRFERAIFPCCFPSMRVTS